MCPFVYCNSYGQKHAHLQNCPGNFAIPISFLRIFELDPPSMDLQSFKSEDLCTFIEFDTALCTEAAKFTTDRFSSPKKSSLEGHRRFLGSGESPSEIKHAFDVDGIGPYLNCSGLMSYVRQTTLTSIILENMVYIRYHAFVMHQFLLRKVIHLCQNCLYLLVF